MQSPFEKFISSLGKSSSIGFIPNTSSLTDSSYGSDSSFSYSSSPNSHSFLKLPPVKKDCWRENVHSELTFFCKKLLRKSGNSGPHSSPSKPKEYRRPQIASSAGIALFSFEPENLELVRSNQLFKDMHANSDCNYDILIEKAKSFSRCFNLAERDVENRELFLTNFGVDNGMARSFAEKQKTLSPVSFIAFLFLVDKYPEAPQNRIFICLKNSDDVYKTFKELDIQMTFDFATKYTIKMHEQNVDDWTQSFSNSL